MNKLQRQQERRRKFHESLLNILYAPPPSPPPPPPPPPQNEIPEDQLLETTLDVEHITAELEEEKSSLSASDDDTESDTRKLTRAQRKRLRKKRLKEASLNRRKIIGPELPTSSTDLGNDNLHSEDGDAVVSHDTQGVRRNAAEGLDSGTDQQLGDTSSCASQNKRKQRRVSRKLAKERLKPLTVETSEDAPSHREVLASEGDTGFSVGI